MEELREKLISEIEQADWDMLRTHHKNGAVFTVSGSLSLLDVALAVAQDKTQFVKIWLDSGELARVTEEQVKSFEQSPFEKICDFLIIRPYVLIKLLA